MDGHWLRPRGTTPDRCCEHCFPDVSTQYNKAAPHRVAYRAVVTDPLRPNHQWEVPHTDEVWLCGLCAARLPRHAAVLGVAP